MPIKKKSDLTDIEKFCLDAYLINNDPDMCYRLSRPRRTKPDSESHHRLALRWIRSDHVQAYLKERRAVSFADSEDRESIGKYRDKDSVLSALEAELPILKGKDRLDCLYKIADLQQMKREDDKQEEERVHFYLPLPICEDCPHKNNLLRKRN